MKKLLSACLVKVLMTSHSFSQSKSNIYRKDWIDFNKNGVMDVFGNSKANINDRVNNMLSLMSVNKKTNQLATIYGYLRVLKDSLPTAAWKNEIWKDGIANIDEHLNGRGNGENYMSQLSHKIYSY